MVEMTVLFFSPCNRIIRVTNNVHRKDNQDTKTQTVGVQLKATI